MITDRRTVGRVRRGERWKQILMVARRRGKITPKDLAEVAGIDRHDAAIALSHHFWAGRLRRVALGVYEVAPHEPDEFARSLDGDVLGPAWVPNLDGPGRERLLALLEKALGPAARTLLAEATGAAIEDVVAAARFLRFLKFERERPVPG